MANAGSGRRGNTRSEAVDPAANRPDPNKRQGAQLILGDAPKKPAWGGKGLDNDAVYQRQNTASGRSYAAWAPWPDLSCSNGGVHSTPLATVCAPSIADYRQTPSKPLLKGGTADCRPCSGLERDSS